MKLIVFLSYRLDVLREDGHRDESLQALVSAEKFRFATRHPVNKVTREQGRGNLFNLDRNDHSLYCLINDTLLASPLLQTAVQQLVMALPGAAFTRLDIAFRDIASLERGEFKLIEADLPPFGDRREKIDEVEYVDATHESSRFYAFQLAKTRTVLLHISIGLARRAFGMTPSLFGILSLAPAIIGRNYECSWTHPGDDLSPISPGVL